MDISAGNLLRPAPINDGSFTVEQLRRRRPLSMRRGLKRVTFTGADDKTPIHEIVELAKDFPFVEVGILVSATNEGKPRYPSREWQRRLRDAALDADIDVAMHICGLYSQEFFHAEHSPWERIGPVKHCARRIQINGAPSHASMRISQWIRELLRRERVKEFIFQIPNGQEAMRQAFNEGLPAFALFDESGGNGKVPMERRAPVGGFTISCAGKRFVGYAGGIGLNNLHRELDKVERACEDDFWIDMEGRLRQEVTDTFDLDIVRAIANECAKRVII